MPEIRLASLAVMPDRENAAFLPDNPAILALPLARGIAVAASPRARRGQAPGAPPLARRNRAGSTLNENLNRDSQ